MTGTAGHGATGGGGWRLAGISGAGEAAAAEAAPLTDRAHGPSAPLSREGLRLHEAFAAAIDDDLDTPRALRIAREALRSGLPAEQRRWLLLDMDLVFGLDLDRAAVEGAGAPARRDAAALTNEARRLVEARTQARANRDFARADRMRAELRELGIEPIDKPDGSSDWRPLD